MNCGVCRILTNEAGQSESLANQNRSQLRVSDVNMNHSELNTPEGRTWLAFQYVSGELSVDGVEAFELAMLADASLCEAVAEMTAVCSAVRQLPANTGAVGNNTAANTVATATQVSLAVVTPTEVKARKSGTGMMLASLVTVVCCGILAVVVSSLPNSTDRPELAVSSLEDSAVEIPAADVVAAELLVDVWANGAVVVVVVDHEFDESELATDDLEVPEWLLAAVAISADEQPATRETELF